MCATKIQPLIVDRTSHEEYFLSLWHFETMPRRTAGARGSTNIDSSHQLTKFIRYSYIIWYGRLQNYKCKTYINRMARANCFFS